MLVDTCRDIVISNNTHLNISQSTDAQSHESKLARSWEEAHHKVSSIVTIPKAEPSPLSNRRMESDVDALIGHRKITTIGRIALRLWVPFSSIYKEPEVDLCQRVGIKPGCNVNSKSSGIIYVHQCRSCASENVCIIQTSQTFAECNDGHRSYFNTLYYEHWALTTHSYQDHGLRSERG